MKNTLDHGFVSHRPCRAVRGGVSASFAFGAVLALGPACGRTVDPVDTEARSRGPAVQNGSSGESAADVPALDASEPNLANTADVTASSQVTTADPDSCAEAEAARTYVGCDYWPTVTANSVWNIFDFAVVVANAGSTTATVTLTGPENTNQTATVPPGQLVKMYAPWVPALKGPDSDNCGSIVPLAASVLSRQGAFHLISTVPVTVYQFNALEYQGMGGPPGKDWSACPGLSACMDLRFPAPIGCLSFSNDASLLLPSTAMTGNYRVLGHGGVVINDPTTRQSISSGGTTSITATVDGTTVNVIVGTGGNVVAGTGIAATPAGGTLTLALNAGDVAELLGEGGSDLSGSIVQASAPVQVITGHPCYEIPPNEQACDHMEESVLPAETIGKDYVVTEPAGPEGIAVAHQVRFYGNFDNTHLTYNPSTPPPGCPTTLAAGQVVECGVSGPCPTVVDPTQKYNCGMISQDFEVTGDQPFAVETFTLGSQLVDSTTRELGDPAQSFAVPVEQYRTKYVFLAPDDYTVSYADIVTAPGNVITLDGQTLASVPLPIGTSSYGIERVALGTGQAGAHLLTAAEPVGLQVVGYGQATSYMFPGGLNLVRIAPAPVIVPR